MTAVHEFTLGDAFDLQMGKTPSAVIRSTGVEKINGFQYQTSKINASMKQRNVSLTLLLRKLESRWFRRER